MKAMKSLKYHIDKVGIVGIMCSHLCCLSLPVTMGFLSGAGAGLSIIHSISLPLMIASIVISILGLFVSWLKHGNMLPLILVVVSSILILVSLATVNKSISMFVGVAGLIAASILNSRCMTKCKAE